jgi:hypothetical protein
MNWCTYTNNEKKDAHNEENEITRGITIKKKVIRARDKGIKYEVDQYFV